MLTVERLNIRDQWVQDFLWKYIVPKDIRQDYTKLDAIKYIEQQIYYENEFLIGNKEVILRCVTHNINVVEPHIMGNGIYFRSTLDGAVEYASKHSPFKQAVIWTHHDSIARIIEKCGFVKTGMLPKYHLTEDGAVDLMSYVREIP